MYLMCSISITMHVFNRAAKFSYFCHVKNLIRVEKEREGGQGGGRERTILHARIVKHTNDVQSADV